MVIVVTLAVGGYPHTLPLLSGEVSSRILTLKFPEGLARLPNSAFRPMVRQQAFDVAEIGMTTYLTCIDAGIPLRAIPVFPARNYPHDSIIVRHDSGIVEPKDLEGKRVAMRTYTVTSFVWARAILQHQYGVDISRLQCVIVDHEHVQSFEYPENVELRLGEDPFSLLKAGEVEAAIGVAPDDDFSHRLIDNVDEGQRGWREMTKFIPVNHVIVLRKEIADTMPTVGTELFRMFSQARELAKIDSITRDDTTTILPKYGLEENSAALSAMLDVAREQHVFTGSQQMSELFLDV